MLTFVLSKQLSEQIIIVYLYLHIIYKEIPNALTDKQKQKSENV